MILRRARPDEAPTLSALAQAAKAHWGYDQAFLDACRAELTHTPESIARRHFVVAESDGVVLGFYSVDGEPPAGELGNLWVHPTHIGTGLGRTLLEHALVHAAATGHPHLTIDADPHAEPFYLHLGATRVGETPSTALPGRQLPQLTIPTR